MTSQWPPTTSTASTLPPMTRPPRPKSPASDVLARLPRAVTQQTVPSRQSLVKRPLPARQTREHRSPRAAEPASRARRQQVPTAQRKKGANSTAPDVSASQDGSKSAPVASGGSAPKPASDAGQISPTATPKPAKKANPAAAPESAVASASQTGDAPKTDAKPEPRASNDPRKRPKPVTQVEISTQRPSTDTPSKPAPAAPVAAPEQAPVARASNDPRKRRKPAEAPAIAAETNTDGGSDKNA